MANLKTDWVEGEIIGPDDFNELCLTVNESMPVSGGTFTGNVKGPDPLEAQDLATRRYVDEAAASATPTNHAGPYSGYAYGLATGAQVGHVYLSDDVASTSDTTSGAAATPNAVRQAYERGTAALTRAEEAYELARLGSSSDEPLFTEWKNGQGLLAGARATQVFGENVIALGGGAKGSSGSVSVGVNAICNSGGGVAVGNDAQAGTGGVSIGWQATGSGVSVGSQTRSGNDAVAIGVRDHSKRAGSTSVSIGYMSTATGDYCVAVGGHTNPGLSDGDLGATGVGYGAKANASGSSAFGYLAAAQSNMSTALGYNSAVSTTDAHTMQLGDAELVMLRSPKSLSVVSDLRDKTDIEDIHSALDFINKVKPVQYVSNIRHKYIDQDTLSEEQKAEFTQYGMTSFDREKHEAGLHKGTRKRVGVLAQQVQEALADVYGTPDYAAVVNNNLHDAMQKDPSVSADFSQLTVMHDAFIPFLIQAIQQLDQKNTLLQEELHALKTELAEIKSV